MKVELKPHEGVQDTPIGPVPVRLPQSWIFVNGVAAGFVGDHEGAPVNLIIGDLPEATVKQIKEEVDKIKGSVSKSINVPVHLTEEQLEALDKGKSVKVKAAKRDEVPNS